MMNYKNILLKLGNNEKFKFKKTDLNNLLNKKEKLILDDFINEMLLLNIIEITNNENDEYEFNNIAYFVYIFNNLNI